MAHALPYASGLLSSETGNRLSPIQLLQAPNIPVYVQTQEQKVFKYFHMLKGGAMAFSITLVPFANL